MYTFIIQDCYYDTTNNIFVTTEVDSAIDRLFSGDYCMQIWRDGFKVFEVYMAFEDYNNDTACIENMIIDVLENKNMHEYLKERIGNLYALKKIKKDEELAIRRSERKRLQAEKDIQEFNRLKSKLKL